MTKQEYFELLKESAYNGTFPSAVKHERGTSCLYRKDKTAGCKQRCAVGLLIKDEDYDSDLDLSPAYEVLHLVDIPEGMTEGDLLNVQMAHDDEARRNEFSPARFMESIMLGCFYDITHPER